MISAFITKYLMPPDFSPAPLAVDLFSHVPYYLQLIEFLKEKIRSGDWKVGDRIPSEPELCAIFGVSRTVVRQALGQLEIEGLVLRRKGKGTFVAEPKITEGLVQTLTGFYQDMLERGRRPTTRILKQVVEPASPAIAQRLRIGPGEMVHMLERLQFVERTPMVLASTYIPYALCPGLARVDLNEKSLYATLENDFGLVLSHGRRTIEAAAAGKREAELLNVEFGAPLLVLDSVTCLEDGRPVEYFHALQPGDRSRFEVELVRLRPPLRNG